jgi:ribosomal protein S18 acetylase RimI-like enzyme
MVSLFSGISSFLPSLGRQHNGLADKDLPKNIKCKNEERQQVSLSLVTKLTDKERKALTEAFLDGEDVWWAAGAGDNETSPADDDTKQRRWQMAHYNTECVLRFAEKFGYIVVARDSEDGEYLGSLCIIPPYKSQKLFTLHVVCSVIPIDKPVLYRFGAESAARFEAFAMRTEEEHHHITKDCKPHWYVANLGVAKTAQGKGIGGILNRAAIAIADGDPIYLECLDSNVAFYEKMGYEHMKRYMITPKTENPVLLPYNGMVHGFKPKSQ